MLATVLRTLLQLIFLLFKVLLLSLLYTSSYKYRLFVQLACV
jgi:hypothetical protein